MKREDSSDILISSESAVGNIETTSHIVEEYKFFQRQGHGEAAEMANHLADKIMNGDFFGEEKVIHCGDEIDPKTGHIVKNGPDRIVNGMEIQSKYCHSGKACISQCFDKDGTFRYMGSNGKPMCIEVPKDQYEEVLQEMRKKIAEGKIPGVNDPNDAEKYVKKGFITYEQSVNIAKAGTIESITYDSVQGVITAVPVFGMSALISYAVSVWNGEDKRVSDGTLWEGQIALYFRWTCLPDGAVPELAAGFSRNDRRLS